MNNSEIEKIRNLNIRKANMDILKSATLGITVTTLTAVCFAISIELKDDIWLLPIMGFCTTCSDITFLKVIKESLKLKEKLKNATPEDISTGKVKHKNLFLK